MVSANTESGRPGHLDPGQQHMVHKLREDWDYNASKDMILEAEAWRRENKVDELYETFTFPEKEAVSKLYPKFYHKTDKDGRPVYIEQLTHLDLNKLFKVTTPERLIQHLVYEYEKCQRERLPVCSEISNKLIETSCTIMDLKNVGVAQFWKVSSYVQQASKIGQCYYPETMGRFYIINAPYIFTTVWTVVKGWLDPVTREKIQILGSNYLGELSKQIPMENIPSMVGGLCQCPGGCLMSDAGPWNTPEGEEIIRRVRNEKQRLKLENSKEHQNSVSNQQQDKVSGAPREDNTSAPQEAKQVHPSSYASHDVSAKQYDTANVPPNAGDAVPVQAADPLAIPTTSAILDAPAPPVQIQPTTTALAPRQ
ncbi:hypothetical protein MNAN1_000772 [Malassezia nana]|uniref:CRAL-TRIO domain-containing protein n=1 Tax=Malassezia nana TaxID=180528 RepID=A0AAF0J189_9BASI|nr:hypothetical protein MNAN1_000772 [Malassezia nana]